MIKKIIIVLLLLYFTPLNNTKAQVSFPSFAVGASFGMSNGVGGYLHISTKNFAENFPFSAKLSFGITSLNAGDPLAARKIFINNNTNGIPEQSGRTLTLAMDFLYRYSILRLHRNYFYFGPRYSMFNGNFNFVGGNEDFDVTADQWGIGVGLENYFRITPIIDLLVNLGYDYYFANTLYGHDTSYTPDGTDLNPREDYTYSDADDAIYQPRHQLKVLLGINYNF